MSLAVISIYLVMVLVLGALSHKLFRNTGEDYFVASRTINWFILLMTLFGTNMTAFSILGASGEAYHRGIGVFALMASSSAIVVPCVFLFIGTRLWRLGKRFGYVTQVQYFRDRWESDGLGLLLFIVFVLLLIPYLLIGVMGGGGTLATLTEGQIPQWLGGLLICAVVLCYVTYSGMRGTAWVNTFQTLVFMVLGGITFFVITHRMGGFSNAIAKVDTGLLMQAEHIKPLELLTYLCVPLCVGMFPHIFSHFLTAKDVGTFRYAIILYPLCIAVVWIPSVLLGILGNVDVPGLQGAQANNVLIQMIHIHAPGVLAGFLGAGVFAAIMSSLDSQSLAIGSMFTHDIVGHYRREAFSERQRVWVGRLFVSGVLFVTYLISLIATPSIFRLAVWSFTGFAGLFPIVVAALFWQRSTKHGVFAAILSVILLWLYFFLQNWQTPGYSVGGIGIMPAAILVAVSSVVLIIVSVFTKPPKLQTLEKFFNQ
ncbi:sodium:solute symporter family protein [Candidatus Poribacteria bacterium]|nr:sodium:solute symporter family protein [Candidatus Poribacteria bacterium]MYA55974.1 sodium:solute symporter family protein [Candidatus Poribacteria bacterium]